MRTYNSKEFFPATLGPDDTLYTYNALDTCLTAELIPALLPNLTEDTSRIYAFECALQGPVLDMTTRGVCIDLEKRAQLTSHYAKKVDQLQSIVMRFGLELWGRPLNVNSPKQMQEFFYGFCNVPPIFKFVKGERKIDTGRLALETLSRHFYLRPLCQTLLALRDAQKSLGFLKSGVDPDGRFRSSYNIAGTDTGRFSSGKNPRGTGWNFQNITEHLRSIFIADPGMKLGYCDLEQAESRGVALLSGDDAYWEACHAGDLHTLVTRLVWVDLEWTGDPKKDRALADRLFYRHFSRRDLAKRGGHGSNYYGKPSGLAKQLYMPTDVIERFQAAYFTAFPGIQNWHREVAYTLQTEGILTTPFGRRRQFHGRLWDDATLRAAIAYLPQSLIVDIVNRGMLDVWRVPHVQILGQVHDAVFFQYPEEREAEILPEVQACMAVPVHHRGKTLTIPSEMAVGWNFEKYSESNPDGMKKWKGGDDRQRTTEQKKSLLDYRF